MTFGQRRIEWRSEEERKAYKLRSKRIQACKSSKKYRDKNPEAYRKKHKAYTSKRRRSLSTEQRGLANKKRRDARKKKKEHSAKAASSSSVPASPVRSISGFMTEKQKERIEGGEQKAASAKHQQKRAQAAKKPEQLQKKAIERAATAKRANEKKEAAQSAKVADLAKEAAAEEAIRSAHLAQHAFLGKSPVAKAVAPFIWGNKSQEIKRKQNRKRART